MYRDIPNVLRALVEPVVADRGFELVDIEVRLGHANGLLRITVDNPVGDGRVGIDRCAQLSREIATQLDAADAIVGAYRLEVSSPGLDRVLAREKDFAAACGREIRLRTRRPLDGRRRFRGKLLAFEAGVAQLKVDGVCLGIAFEDVEKANAVYEFSPADFNRRVAD